MKLISLACALILITLAVSTQTAVAVCNWSNVPSCTANDCGLYVSAVSAPPCCSSNCGPECFTPYNPACRNSTGCYCDDLCHQYQDCCQSWDSVCNIPVVLSTSPVTLPTQGGVMLSIVGDKFTSTVGSVTISGNACSVISWTSTLIVCVSPAGTGAGKPLVVTVSSKSSAPVTISYNAPSISSLFPSNGPTSGGLVLTLTGVSFGSNPGVATVTLDGVACPIVSLTHSQIKSTLPPGSGTFKLVRVNVDGQISNAVAFNYDPPAIFFVSPNNGPTVGNTVVTIVGNNFGTTGVATIGGQVCSAISYSHTSVVCLSPPGQGVFQPLIVTVAGSSSSPAFFNYNAPSLSAVIPSSGPSAGGIIITLSGTNFGTSGVVSVGGSTCPVTTYAQTAITCVLPAGTGNVPVSVTVSGQSSNSAVFNYV